MTNTYTVEGESIGDPIAYAEQRAEDLRCGILTEEDHEVSSFSSMKPRATVELLMNEDEDLWVEVVG